MKKPLLVLLWLLLSALLPGCQPYLTYDEMHVARDAAETPEARAKIEKRIERFENDAERSNSYFELRRICSWDKEYVWFCFNPQYTERQVDRMLASQLTLDERVKLYRRVRISCDCVSRDAIKDMLQNF